MLWTTRQEKIVDSRLKHLLQEIGVTGYRTFPIRAMDCAGVERYGYEGFVVVGGTGDEIDTLKRGQQVFSFIASDQIVPALREARVTDLAIEPWDE